MITPRFLLHITHTGLSLWTWHFSELQQGEHFPNEAHGHHRFSELLAEHRPRHVSLLIELPDEQQRLIKLPPLRGRDCERLLQRHINREFPTHVLSATRQLRASPANPSTENWLIQALPDSPALTPWLERLASAETALHAIHTPSQLVGALHERIKIQENKYLLLVPTDEVLHEFFVIDRQVNFFRSQPHPESHDHRFIREQAARIYAHLQARSLILPEETPPILVIDHSNRIDVFPDPEDNPLKAAWIGIDLLAAIGKVRLRTTVREASPLQLFLHLQATSRLPGYQVRITAQESYRQQLKRWLNPMGWLALFTVSLLALRHNDQALQIKREHQALMAAPIEPSAQAETIAAGHKTMSADHTTINSLIESRTTLGRQQILPDKALDELSQIFDQHKAIKLDGLEWKIVSARASTAKAPEAMREVVVIRGLVPHGANAQAEFEHFLTALRQRPEQTTVLKQTPDSGTFVIEISRPI